MKNIKILIIIISAFAFISAAYAEDMPRAYMKAQYNEWYKYYGYKDTTEVRISTSKYILQIADGMSYYYDPQTFKIDSLDSTPSGRAMLDETFDKLLMDSMNGGPDPFKKREEMGLTRGKRYRARKNFNEGNITIWDSYMADKHRYDVDMSDLQWTPGDSTKTVMGYECVNATADYHGRKWEAWFAPELAVQDGPWQLCGLPGLIMEAHTLDGEYGFEITGIQKCDEPLKETFETDKYFHSKRKSFLKTKSYTRKHMSEHISAMTGGKVKPKIRRPAKEVDLIETDYNQ